MLLHKAPVQPAAAQLPARRPHAWPRRPRHRAAAAEDDKAEASVRPAAEAATAAAASGAAASSSTAAAATVALIPSVPESVAEQWAGWTVVVAGATGGVGKQVVSALQARGASVRALVRDAAKAEKKLPLADGGVTLVKADIFQYASLPPAFEADGGGNVNALIICTGASDPRDPFGPFNVDYQGTSNLLAAAKAAGVGHVVLVTSIGADDPFNPLNLFWGVLFWKKRAEEVLQRSGVTYTIVRPGGLTNRVRDGRSPGNIVMAGPNSYGFPPLRKSGSILRSQVAEVCVEALVLPSAKNKVVEVIAEQFAPRIDLDTLFQRVAW